MLKNVDYKIEAFRIATLVMCQSATAAQIDKKSSPDEVMTFAKQVYVWLISDESEKK